MPISHETATMWRVSETESMCVGCYLQLGTQTSSHGLPQTADSRVLHWQMKGNGAATTEPHGNLKPHIRAERVAISCAHHNEKQSALMPHYKIIPPTA